MNLIYGIQNVSFFDSHWALFHFIFGLIVGLILIQKNKKSLPYITIGMGIMIFWEVFEATVRYYKSNPQFFAILKALHQEWFLGIESYVNVISDLVLGGVGLLLVYYYTENHSTVRVPVEIENKDRTDDK